jgi:hypothetical protein
MLTFIIPNTKELRTFIEQLTRNPKLDSGEFSRSID